MARSQPTHEDFGEQQRIRSAKPCRGGGLASRASLRAQAAKLYHLGIRGNVSRNTLANANATRDWRIYASFAERLIGIARGLYAEEPFGVDLYGVVLKDPRGRAAIVTIRCAVRKKPQSSR